MNEAMSAGSVRMTAASPPPPDMAGTGLPRATASNSARTWPVSFNASARNRIVSLRGAVAMPALQVADRTMAQACRLGQLLLG